MASMLNALMQQNADARNPLVPASQAAPATPTAPQPAAASPDAPASDPAWINVGRGEGYAGEPGSPYNASFQILPSSKAPDAGKGNALFRFNMHRRDLEDMSEAANNGSTPDHVSGHVGSKALEKDDRQHDEKKTSAALEAVARRMERMIKRKELTLEKRRRDENDDTLPSNHSVFVRIERGKDAPYHKVSKDDHDKAERAYAKHQAAWDDARSAYAQDGNGESAFKTGYMPSFMTPDQMALPTAQERSAHVNKYQRSTGDSFDKWTERSAPEKFKTYKAAEALADIQKAIGDRKGWHNVPV